MAGKVINQGYAATPLRWLPDSGGRPPAIETGAMHQNRCNSTLRRDKIHHAGPGDDEQSGDRSRTAHAAAAVQSPLTRQSPFKCKRIVFHIGMNGASLLQRNKIKQWNFTLSFVMILYYAALCLLSDCTGPSSE